jgi:hypothetical protein
MSKQKLLVWDPAQKRWVPQRRTSGGGGGGGGGYSEVIVGDTSLTSDAGDPLTIAATPPIQVTGDADTDTVTIGIRMGPGSNLDADTVDGKHAADFALSSHSHPNATTTSAGFMSASDKAKLDSIEDGAEANQLAYSVVKVGSTSVAAQSTTDTLELEAGSNIALTPDAAARKVALAVSPQGHTSGLDADLLDGQHASAFAPATHTHVPTQVSPQGHGSGLDADTVDGKHASEFAASSHQHAPADIDPQGHTSGLDADLLDGQHASAFAPASHTHPDATPTSSGFLSAADKAKLDGIQPGAEVNQNAFSRVLVGSTAVEADTKTDTLELAAGNNITLTPDATNDKVTIAVAPQGAGSGLDADLLDGNHASAFALASHTHPDATTTDSGFMSAADKAKLDGIESGAEVNQNAFSQVKVGSSTIAADSKTDVLELAAGSNIALTADETDDKVTIAVSPQGAGSGLDADLLDGNHASAFALASHNHPNATPSSDGFMSAADKAKLDGIEAGAQVNQNAFSRVIVGSTNIDAGSITDALRLIAGANITLTPDAGNKSVTIAASGGGGGGGGSGYGTVSAGSTTLTADPGDTLTIQGASPITVSGDADTDTVTIGIQTGSGSGLDADTVDGMHSSDFASATHTHPDATTTASGFMSAADKQKLDNAKSFSTVSVGSQNLAAASLNDTLNLQAGVNVTLSADPATKTVTVSSAGLSPSNIYINRNSSTIGFNTTTEITLASVAVPAGTYLLIAAALAFYRRDAVSSGIYNSTATCHLKAGTTTLLSQTQSPTVLVPSGFANSNSDAFTFFVIHVETVTSAATFSWTMSGSVGWYLNQRCAHICAIRLA